MSKAIFNPTDPALFFSKNDVADERLGDRTSAIDGRSLGGFEKDLAAKNAGGPLAVLAGYPDDEGISINGGRIGAALAPDRIRRFFYKMTPSFFAPETLAQIADVGNLAVENFELRERHENARGFARATMASPAQWFSLGGGHDYGYADSSAFVDVCLERGVKPLVLNFDAHLDVRPPSNGLSSGTPFYRLLDLGHAIDFAEIGLQGQCNSATHARWLESKGGRLLSMEEIDSSGEGFTTSVLKMLGSWIERRRPVFLSVDIDGFQSAAAPGCSQSWATGFTPADFFTLWQILNRRLDVRGIGIYEVSPPLDQDDRTSKLAAQILHRTLFVP